MLVVHATWPDDDEDAFIGRPAPAFKAALKSFGLGLGVETHGDMIFG